MIVGCPKCGAKYQYDESRFGDAEVKHLKCSRCDSVFDVHRPAAVAAGAATIAEPVKAPEARPAPKNSPDDTTKELDVSAMEARREDASLPQLAPLPPNRRYSVAVILGPNSGQIFQITRPRVFIGRGAGADLQLNDSEISRRHAMIEIRGEGAVLVDLESTNGTFVDSVRIQRAELAPHQEFTIGTSTLMFIVTDAGPDSH